MEKKKKKRRIISAEQEREICLNGPLPECEKFVCERFKQEVRRIKANDR